MVSSKGRITKGEASLKLEHTAKREEKTEMRTEMKNEHKETWNANGKVKAVKHRIETVENNTRALKDKHETLYQKQF